MSLVGEIAAQSPEECTEAKFIEKLLATRVEGEGADLEKAQQAAQTKSSTSKGQEKFEFTNEEQAKEAINDVRNDATETNFVCFGYDESDKIALLKKGSNGLAGAQELANDDVVVYIVLTVPMAVEGTILVKYIFITWIGPNVKPFVRARSSQHKLPFYKFVNTLLQLGGELQALQKEELTEELIKKKLLGTRVLSEEGVASDNLRSKGTGASEKFQFEDEAAFISLLEKLRDPKNPLSWIKLGYKEGSEDLSIESSGNNSVDEFAGSLGDEEVHYVLFGMKVKDEVNYATHVKFVCITWVGPDVKPLHRARSSQHRNSLYQFSKKYLQLAGELQVLNRADLSETKLLEKLAGAFTQTGRTEEELRAAAELDAKKKLAKGLSPCVPRRGGGGGEDEFKTALQNEKEAIEVFKELFNATNTSNWAAFTYLDGKNVVSLVGKGEGDISNLKVHFKSDNVVYSILGITTPGEGDYSITKYLFITWVGPEVKPLHKARSSQHRVPLYNFANKHITLTGEVSAQSEEDCETKKLLEKLSSSRQESELKAPSSPAPSSPAVRGKTAALFSLNEAAITETVSDLRNSNTQTNWAIFGQEGSQDSITVLGKGANGLDGMKALLKDDEIVYGVLSVLVEEKESGDEYKTYKNIFISWVGPDVKPLVKAKSSQHRLGLYNFLKTQVTLSGELQALSSADLTMDLVMEKLTSSRFKQN
jgi:hypothetical protein